ncbi:MAG: NAD(P)/FAD-dependent oxidoreductase [Arenicella sp.]
MKNIVLPCNDQHNAWFQQLSIPSISNKSKELQDRHYDYVVLGAGFVGTAAAYRLGELNPDKDIALLEADRVGNGASGRNSGFIIDLPHKGDLEGQDLQKKHMITRLNRAAIDFLESNVTRHNIQCNWSRAGKYQGAVGERGEKYLQHFAAILDEMQEPYDILDQSDISKITGTNHYSQAIYTPGTILLQPAALMRGTIDNMPTNVGVYENTPVMHLQKQYNHWKILSKNATITASKVILATNIFSEQLGVMRNRMVPIMTFASMTRPLTDKELSNYSGTLDWGLTPADHAGTTVRMTSDRRLIIRNQYQYVSQYNSNTLERRKIRQKHIAAKNKRFPELQKVPFEHTWGGVCAISRNSQSVFGELQTGLYASICHNGVGGARGTISGKLLAEQVSGMDSQLLRDMQAVSGRPAIVPPKPLLGIGVRARLKLASWNSRSEQ